MMTEQGLLLLQKESSNRCIDSISTFGTHFSFWRIALNMVSANQTLIFDHFFHHNNNYNDVYGYKHYYSRFREKKPEHAKIFVRSLRIAARRSLKKYD
jgi:hypothetical protein